MTPFCFTGSNSTFCFVSSVSNILVLHRTHGYSLTFRVLVRNGQHIPLTLSPFLRLNLWRRVNCRHAAYVYRVVLKFTEHINRRVQFRVPDGNHKSTLFLNKNTEWEKCKTTKCALFRITPGCLQCHLYVPTLLGHYQKELRNCKKKCIKTCHCL